MIQTISLKVKSIHFFIFIVFYFKIFEYFIKDDIFRNYIIIPICNKGFVNRLTCNEKLFTRIKEVNITTLK